MLRLPRPPGPQARVPQAVDHPHQRGRPRARPALQRVHRRPEEGQHRARPQDALRNGDRPIRPRSTPWWKRPAKRCSCRLTARLAWQACTWPSPNSSPSSMRLQAAAQPRFASADDAAALEAARDRVLGAKAGRLKDAQQGLGGRQGRQAGGRQAVQRSQAGRRGGVRSGPGAAGVGRLSRKRRRRSTRRCPARRCASAICTRSRRRSRR